MHSFIHTFKQKIYSVSFERSFLLVFNGRFWFTFFSVNGMTYWTFSTHWTYCSVTMFADSVIDNIFNLDFNLFHGYVHVWIEFESVTLSSVTLFSSSESRTKICSSALANGYKKKKSICVSFTTINYWNCPKRETYKIDTQMAHNWVKWSLNERTCF